MCGWTLIQTIFHPQPPYASHLVVPMRTQQPYGFFLVLALNSSAIKVDKVHRWLGLGSMYSESCLATGWDAGRALLDKGECNGGAYPDGTVHSMQEVGLAMTTNVNTCYVRTDGTCRSRESRKLKVQNLQPHTSGRQVSDNRGFTGGVP